MTTTTLLRSWWAPACKGPFTRVELYGEGVVSVDPAIVPAVKALDAILEKHSYETRKADTGAFNCRVITGGTNYSLHAYGIAIDINWQSNPYGRKLITDMPAAMVAEIKALRTKNGKQVWRWGGDYSGNKDAMHFEIICSPSDLESGLASKTPPLKPAPPIDPKKDTSTMYIVNILQDDGKTATPFNFLFDETHREVFVLDETSFWDYAVLLKSDIRGIVNDRFVRILARFQNPAAHLKRYTG